MSGFDNGFVDLKTGKTALKEDVVALKWMVGVNTTLTLLALAAILWR